MVGRKQRYYLEGARVDELPMPDCPSNLIDNPSSTTSDRVSLTNTSVTNPRRRRIARRLPFGYCRGLCPIMYDLAYAPNSVAAYKARLLRTIPEPDEAVFSRFEKFVMDTIRAEFEPVVAPTFDEWLEASPYPEWRRQQLRSCHADLRGGAPTKEHCRRVRSFIKCESYPSYKYPRKINSRSDHFKAYSGRFFKAIEAMVYRHPWFVKHDTPEERMAKVQALKVAGLHYYATDYTAFESHFTAKLLKACEVALYRHALSSYPEASEVIARAICGQSQMRSRNGVTCELTARRMSGDMCTSLGNGFTNMMIARFLAHEQGENIVGVVEGDDGLFATRAILRADDYASIGFTVKIDEVADPCTASFCGLVYGDAGQIVRDPMRFLQNFGWTTSCIEAKESTMMELLRAKALSACYETPHCPIIGAVARRALYLTRRSKARFIQDGYHVAPPDAQDVPAFAPDETTRNLFAELYGISPAAQVALEESISSGGEVWLPTLPSPDVTHAYARFVVAG